MHVTKVLSFLGAWQAISDRCPHIITEIENALNTSKLSEITLSEPRQPYSHRHKQHLPRDDSFFREVSRQFTLSLTKMGWEREVKIAPNPNETFRYMAIDAVKANVGVEIVMGSRSFAESMLFARFPLFTLAKKFEIGVLLVPVSRLARSLSNDMGSNFEGLNEVLKETSRLVKYPFVVLGFDTEPCDIEVTYLTTELDEFLIQHLHHTLAELMLIHEMPNYDFKFDMPKSGSFRNTVCAFANLSHGGFFIFGASDSGEVPGIAKGKALDDLKLRIFNSFNEGKYEPRPTYNLYVFDAPNNSDRSILIMHVEEAALRPCMLNDKVYSRSGSSTVVAGPEAVRRIVLGQI